jgi:hypothetical protein
MEYDSDKDPSGMIGIALADAVYRKQGWKAFTRDERDWPKITRVALRRFNELQRGESISVGEIRRRLREIKGVGYDVSLASGMSKEGAWNYLTQVKREVVEQAERHCPDALREVREANRNAKYNAWLVR